MKVNTIVIISTNRKIILEQTVSKINTLTKTFLRQQIDTNNLKLLHLLHTYAIIKFIKIAIKTFEQEY